MRISESISRFEFHDSSVDSISYSHDTQLLEITIEFSEWVEETQKRAGRFVFHNIGFLKSDPDLAALEWDGRFFADVIEFKHLPELDHEAAEGVRISMELRQHEGKSKGLLVMEFSATHFEWSSETTP